MECRIDLPGTASIVCFQECLYALMRIVSMGEEILVDSLEPCELSQPLFISDVRVYIKTTWRVRRELTNWDLRYRSGKML